MTIAAVVYVPDAITGRVPGIVSISGHATASKAADYVQQRNVNLALRGCVVLSYEFPLEEAEKSYQWAHQVYRLLSAENAVTHYESTTAHGYQEDNREQLYRAVERWLRPPLAKGDKELPVKVESVAEFQCGLPEKNLTFRDIYAEWLKPLPRVSALTDPAAQGAFLRRRLGWPQPRET